MSVRYVVLGTCLAVALSAASVVAAPPASSLADAAMNGNRQAVKTLLAQKVNVNVPQADGTTALHWAVRADDLETANLLIRAGANVSTANQDGATPMLLATINGNAAMIEALIKAGADPNAPLRKYGDTALMMAARTGRTDAVKVLLTHGAKVNTAETWGGTTALMWAVSEGHADVVKMLVDAGADVNARSKYLPAPTGRGFEGDAPEDNRTATGSATAVHNHPAGTDFSGGMLTPLLFAAREGDMESAKLLVAAGADVNAEAGDKKSVLGLAAYNGNYELASFLIDNHADVNHADSERFTPLFWAVDHRDNETPTSFPWMVTRDALPLIEKLLDAGADPNALINNTNISRQRNGEPRILYATALHRAAFSGDLAVVKVLLAHGADPHIISTDLETTLLAASGNGLILGYQKSRPAAERVEVVKLLVELGEDVNAADKYGITPLMVAANMGDDYIQTVQYLIDHGADLGAHDLGKKNDGNFGASVEPLMPLDYAIGVGTFLPNNSIVPHPAVRELMTRVMKEKGIKHTTSECTLRGFTCSTANVEPKAASPSDIARARKVQLGPEVDARVVGGLSVSDGSTDQDKTKDQQKK